MSQEEAATLAARAATTPELEDFEGGFLVALAYAAFGAALIALAWAVGVLFGFPVGFDHSLRGRPFIPKEIWSEEPGMKKTVVVLAVIAGFPLYGLGYCAGIPLRSPAPPAPEPAPAEIEARVTDLDPERVLGVALLDLPIQDARALDVEGGLRLTSVETRAFDAGARTGDVLVRIGEMPVTGANIRKVLQGYVTSTRAELTLLRGGSRLTTRVPLRWK
jgi:hypothetical protein